LAELEDVQMSYQKIRREQRILSEQVQKLYSENDIAKQKLSHSEKLQVDMEDKLNEKTKALDQFVILHKKNREIMGTLEEQVSNL